MGIAKAAEGGRRREKMKFEEYVAEIQTLAEECGAADPGKPYCDAEAWREAFDDGMTPSEAWREECLAAAEMQG
jgi:hypothetical protein